MHMVLAWPFTEEFSFDIEPDFKGQQQLEEAENPEKTSLGADLLGMGLVWGILVHDRRTSTHTEDPRPAAAHAREPKQRR